MAKMQDLIAAISQADSNALDRLLAAVLQRYAVLYPDWEVSTISLLQNEDQNQQLDRIIHMLQNMKISP